MSGERIAKQFGRNLAEARGWAGLTQKQLAAKVSMDQAEIARLERGDRFPRLDRIAALAGVLGVLVRDLLFEIE